MRHCGLDRGFLSVIFLEVQLLGVSVTHCCVTITNLVALNTTNHDFTVFVGWESWLDLLFRVSRGCKVLAGPCAFQSSGFFFKVTSLLEDGGGRTEVPVFLLVPQLLEVVCSSLPCEPYTTMAVDFIKASRESLQESPSLFFKGSP